MVKSGQVKIKEDFQFNHWVENEEEPIKKRGWTKENDIDTAGKKAIK